MIKKIRNVAIIAHVDHGKTTLVDKLLQQSGSLGRKQTATRIMDSNELEKERGITILAKNTAIDWQGVRINIVDTPGHADFGGEVERILSMVDAVLLVVDSVEGPMPQTRFVTQKAFMHGLTPLVVINKIDRPGARCDAVIDEIFDLFIQLDATDEQLDFSVIYASALQGFATLSLEKSSSDMAPLLDLIVDSVPEPDVDQSGPFLMQVSALDYSTYVGAIAIGRIKRGQVKRQMPIIITDSQGQQKKGRIKQVLVNHGVERIDEETAQAGDIVGIVGVERPKISDTIADIDHPEMMDPLDVDEPTVHMTFMVNNSPFVGRDGQFVTSRQLYERLQRELIHNVALRVETTESSDRFRVSGRGELHLAILIETMRREGYELAVSRPQVIYKTIDGKSCEPIERLVVDTPPEFQGQVMALLGPRGAQVHEIGHSDQRMRITFIVPTRGLFGFQTALLTATQGTALMSHVFDHYAVKQKDVVSQRVQGVLVANAAGTATAYALWNLQGRGRMMIKPQEEVYEGMVVGLHSRENDLVVNVQRTKQLTNVRASGSDDNILLTPPFTLTLEEAMTWIGDDELVEITPKYMRIRKYYLREVERKRNRPIN